MSSPRELLKKYPFEPSRNTIIEIVSKEEFRESLPGCTRIQDILQSLSRSAIESPQPLVSRELVLPVEFATLFPSPRRNSYRGQTVPRFLVVDLDSFQSIVVDCGTAQKNDPSSATRRTGRNDCNHDAPAGFAAAHG